jgi:DNA-binding CsgD family transcriptional regulator
LERAFVLAMVSAGVHKKEIAEQMGITRMSVYRALKKRRLLTEQAAE